MIKGLVMDIEGVGVGFSVSLVILFFMGITAAVSASSIEHEIALSCEISGHVVINDKAYKCELMK
jgi:hypothetical protein